MFGEAQHQSPTRPPIEVKKILRSDCQKIAKRLLGFRSRGSFAHSISVAFSATTIPKGQDKTEAKSVRPKIKSLWLDSALKKASPVVLRTGRLRLFTMLS